MYGALDRGGAMGRSVMFGPGAFLWCCAGWSRDERSPRRALAAATCRTVRARTTATGSSLTLPPAEGNRPGWKEGGGLRAQEENLVSKLNYSRARHALLLFFFHSRRPTSVFFFSCISVNFGCIRPCSLKFGGHLPSFSLLFLSLFVTHVPVNTMPHLPAHYAPLIRVLINYAVSLRHRSTTGAISHLFAGSPCLWQFLTKQNKKALVGIVSARLSTHSPMSLQPFVDPWPHFQIHNSIQCP
jgi:hypothetical protein